MKKHFTKLTSVIICVCLMIPLLCACASYEVHPSLWLLEGENGAKIYFFGSIHIGDESLYPLGDYITNAYNECEYLAVEYDIIAAEEAAEKMTQAELLEYYRPFIYTDGTTIKDHISENVYDAAKEFLEENDSYDPALDYYKPSMWESTIQNILIEQSGFDSNYGIDRHFLKLAHEEGKKILEVESEDFQVEMLGKIPDALTEETLLALVTEDAEFQYKYLLDLFKRGRDDILATMNYSSSDKLPDESSENYEHDKMYYDYNKMMLDDRNEGMVQKAITYLEEGKTVFYVVGAAHMVSDRGIIESLRDQGYTVTKI